MKGRIVPEHSQNINDINVILLRFQKNFLNSFIDIMVVFNHSINQSINQLINQSP